VRNRSEAAVAILATAVLFGGCVLIAVKSALALDGALESPAAVRTHVVEIREFRYEPANLVVSAGDTIRWINRDPVPHTATARDSTWDSGRIAAGGDWRMVATEEGTPEYFCVYHPVMTARISVEKASAE
jgi:plastocyanin